LKRTSLSGQIADVDLKLLRVFKAVVECGGFSAAEVELNIGRSAISRMMADLEARLDLHLCLRGRSGFQLTEHGRLVYEATEELMVDLEKFRANVNAAHSRLVGELTLALTDNMLSDAKSPVVDSLGAFHQRAPEVEIRLLIASPNEVERAVIEGRANLGVAPVHHQLPGLQYQPLYQERSAFYCGARHPLFNQHTVTLEDIGQYGFIAPGYHHSVLLQERFPQLQVAASSSQVEGIATLILSGQYLGFLPAHYAAQWVEKQQMRALLCEQLTFEVPFALVLRRDARANPLREALLEAFPQA